MEESKFAVVIVTYNRLRLLRECLEHILQQTKPVAKVIIVNNASTDGTGDYLAAFASDERFCIVDLEENFGGAFGFYKALSCAMNFEWDWITLIDDDAILNYDFHEKIQKQILIDRDSCLAYTGKVLTDGIIAKEHRVISTSKHFYRVKPMRLQDYEGETAELDYASFCGLVLAKRLIEKIGFPMYQLFIRCDDFEYCMRIRKYSRIINVNHAIIEHRTAINTKEKDLSWKLYYAIRNGIIVSNIHYGAIAKHEMCIRYLLGYVKNLVFYVCIKQRISLYELTDLYIPAIVDGYRHKLGKR